MRIRKRPVPHLAEILPDLSPHLQKSYARVQEERERKRGGTRLHHQEEQEGDLSRNLPSWSRSSIPILSQVLQQENRDQKDSDNPSINSSKRVGVDSRAAMEEKERPMEKVKSGAILMDGKKRQRPAVMVEGSRCSRVNGRGWRCSQYTLVGYSLCEHHLGKGRLRSMSSVRAGGATKQRIKANAIEDDDDDDEILEGVKARSMSSLINQPSSLISAANACSS